MANAITLLVTIDDRNNNRHMLTIDPGLWQQDSETVMHKIREAIDGMIGQELRYGIRHSCWTTGDAAGGHECQPGVLSDNR